MKQIFFALLAMFALSSAFAQTAGTITTGTNSNAAQTSSINNAINLGSSGDSEVGYHGTYTVKSAPTVYAPNLTASITETCWGSISGAVSVVGVGVSAGATIKDYDCNRRLTAAIAGRMGRMDVAFNIMCQDDQFRAGAALTNTPCPANTVEGKQGTEIVPGKDAAKNDNLVTPTPVSSNSMITDPKSGVMQYRVADTTPAK